jgi:hypothetical protein
MGGCISPEESSGLTESNLFDCTGFFKFRSFGRSICNTDMESPTVARRASSIERVKDDAHEKGLCRNSARSDHDGRQHGLQYPPPELQCVPKLDRLPSLQYRLAEGWNRLRALPWFPFPSTRPVGAPRTWDGWSLWSERKLWPGSWTWRGWWPLGWVSRDGRCRSSTSSG